MTAVFHGYGNGMFGDRAKPHHLVRLRVGMRPMLRLRLIIMRKMTPKRLHKVMINYSRGRGLTIRSINGSVSLWPSSSPRVICGVLAIRGHSGSLVNWFSAFSDEPSLKIAKLPACLYAEIFHAKPRGPCCSYFTLPR
jgi:hypothetical protein